MKTTKSKTYKAEATFGLKRGYKEELISLEEFKMELAAAQQKVFRELELKISAKVSLCSIVFSGQDEPSIEISFIQYPKFQYDELILKNGILRLVQILMQALDQNRVVVVLPDETIMLEEDESQLDPGISFVNSKPKSSED